MADVFISYDSEDRAAAKIIAAALEKHNLDVWLDEKILAGQPFRKIIAQELGLAKCVVVLWSRNSIESEWVISEATEGKTRQVLVPVLIEAVQAPHEFRQMQFADLAGWNGDNENAEFVKLVRSVQFILGRKGDDIPSHTSERKGAAGSGAAPGPVHHGPEAQNIGRLEGTPREAGHKERWTRLRSKPVIATGIVIVAIAGYFSYGVLFTGKGMVSGIIRDQETTLPLSGVLVSCEAMGGPHIDKATTTRKGVYEFTDLNAGYHAFIFSLQGYDPDTTVLMIDPGVRIDTNVYLSKAMATTGRGGILQGMVRDRSTQRPVSGAIILMDNIESAAVSNKEGLYKLSNIPPGQYNLRAQHQDYAESGLGLIAIFSENATTKDIFLSKPESNGDTPPAVPDETPAKTGTLVGSVISASSRKPLPGASVKVQLTSAGSTRLARSYGVVSDRTGNYTLSGLAPGVYSIQGSCSGYTSKRYDSVRIAAGKVRNQLILLSKTEQRISDPLEFMVIAVDDSIRLNIGRTVVYKGKQSGWIPIKLDEQRTQMELWLYNKKSFSTDVGHPSARRMLGWKYSVKFRQGAREWPFTGSNAQPLLSQFGKWFALKKITFLKSSNGAVSLQD